MGCSRVACTCCCWSCHHFSSWLLWLGRSKVHPITIGWVLPLGLCTTIHFERLLLSHTPIINVYTIELIVKVSSSSSKAWTSSIISNIYFGRFGACEEASCWSITFGEGSIHPSNSTATASCTSNAATKVSWHYSLRCRGAQTNISLYSWDSSAIGKVVIKDVSKVIAIILNSCQLWVLINDRVSYEIQCLQTFQFLHLFV